MHRFLISILFLVTAYAAVGGAGLAHAQVGLHPSAGWNGGVHGDLTRRADVLQADTGPFFGLDLFNGHFDEPGRRQRWGLGLGTQLIRLVPDLGDSYASKYRAVQVQIETERLLSQSHGLELIWGVGVGLLKLAHSSENDDWNYCDSALCGLDDFHWVLSPNLGARLRITNSILLSGQVRGNLYTGEAGETFPYKTGLVLRAGLEFRLGAWPGTEKVQVPRESAGGELP